MSENWRGDPGQRGSRQPEREERWAGRHTGGAEELEAQIDNRIRKCCTQTQEEKINLIGHGAGARLAREEAQDYVLISGLVAGVQADWQQEAGDWRQEGVEASKPDRQTQTSRQRKREREREQTGELTRRMREGSQRPSQTKTLWSASAMKARRVGPARCSSSSARHMKTLTFNLCIGHFNG